MKRTVAYLLALMMILTIVPFNVGIVSADTNEEINGPVTSSVGGAVWDCIYFGEYPQSEDGEGGYITEPIKWKVVSVEGDEALLIAEKILDVKPFKIDQDEEELFWSNSDLRIWLNGYSNNEDNFLDSAFSESDQKAIIEKDVINDYRYYSHNDGRYYSEESSSTKDKVICLSYDDIRNEKLFSDDYDEPVEVTDYAASKESKDASTWWIRTTEEKTAPYYMERFAEDYEGEDASGTSTTYRLAESDGAINDIRGVRPVIYVDLSKADWEYAGKVTYGEDNSIQDAELKDPIIDSNGRTTWDCIYFGEDTIPHPSDKLTSEHLGWRVLSVDDGTALLMCDTVFTIRDFDALDSDSGTPVVWEKSDLRYYLNNEFLDSKFTKTEQDAIIAKKIHNPDNPKYETDSGVATKDKVYVLSVSEARNDDYGFRNSSSSTTTRAVDGVGGAYWYDDDPTVHEIDYEYKWWLRTAGENNNNITYVREDGSINMEGCAADYVIGVRPVINLDLSAPVWKYAGTRTEGGVGTVKNLKVSNVGTNYIKLSWSQAKNADGYQIYRYNASSGKYVLYQTVKNSTACTIKKLKAGTGYKFKVRAYMGSKPYYGNYSTVVTAVTKPLKVTMNNPTTGRSHYVKVTWKKRSCTGYEVKLATNSKFTKGVKTYQAKSNKTLSKKFTGLKKGKRYYVKVRAYKAYNGARQYGSWSSIKSVYCK